MTVEIRANSVLPARREPVTLRTADGVELVGEWAWPLATQPAATVICVHPLPTAGGSMDSHLLRKMSWRLPALADVAVLRFNTRGTSSAFGASAGAFDGGPAETRDLQGAIDEVQRVGLPPAWLLGWSFGTDVISHHAATASCAGAIFISPPQRFSGSVELARWPADVPLRVLVPENDDFLPPDSARQAFAAVPGAEVRVGAGAGHLWIGERNVRFVLNSVIEWVNPTALTDGSLPTKWDGPMTNWSDL